MADQPLSPEAALLVLIELAEECVNQEYQRGADTFGDADAQRLHEAKLVLLDRIGDLWHG